MSATWVGDPPPPPAQIGPLGWLRVLGKGGILGVVVFGGLGVLLLFRLIEAPLYGLRRPWTPFITQAVCRSAFWILGIGYSCSGPVLTGDGVIVANHASWLDIFALNAARRVYFVAKADVAGWPGIGWLARATGTVFIERSTAEAGRQRDLFARRLEAGHRLLFFPEGTSTDGRRVLAFKPALFQAMVDGGFPVQPASLAYTAPPGADPRFYGWWGDMGFGPHLVQILAQSRHGRVEVTFHPPLEASSFTDRKSLARAAEATVRDGFEARVNSA
ncbi:MAG: lysophospholipid acyltransferase family protein [Pseudomonadota bacterium]